MKTVLPLPRSGETIGPYRIDRRLGHGERSVVYAATNVATARTVALRVMTPDDDDPQQRRRLTLAARWTASVSSPNVARVHLYGEHGGHFYVASDLIVDGGTLARALSVDGAAPDLAGLDLMAQVASGLAAVHERGLVHGAVSPGNVWLMLRGGRLVGLLSDAGLGRRDTAPEVLLGEDPTMASDVHSLGALVWSTLTGEQVHPGTGYQLADGFVHDRVPLLLGESPRTRHLNDVLARAMDHDPTKRHASALELRADLLSAMELPGEGLAGEGLGGVALARAPAVPIRPHLETIRTTTLLALALLVVALTAGAVMFFGSF